MAGLSLPHHIVIYIFCLLAAPHTAETYTATACWDDPTLLSLVFDCFQKGVIVLDLTNSFLGYQDNCVTTTCCANTSTCRLPITSGLGSHHTALLAVEGQIQTQVPMTQDQNTGCARNEATDQETVFYTCSLDSTSSTITPPDTITPPGTVSGNPGGSSTVTGNSSANNNTDNRSSGGFMTLWWNWLLIVLVILLIILCILLVICMCMKCNKKNTGKVSVHGNRGVSMVELPPYERYPAVTPYTRLPPLDNRPPPPPYPPDSNADKYNESTTQPSPQPASPQPEENNRTTPPESSRGERAPSARSILRPPTARRGAPPFVRLDV